LTGGAGSLGTAGAFTPGTFGDAGSGPPGSAVGGAGRNTKYSTSAIASTSTTLSAMISPSGTEERFGAAGRAVGAGAGFGVGGVGVADCRINIV